MAKYKVKAKDCQLEVKVKLSMREKLDGIRQITRLLEKVLPPDRGGES